MLIHKLIPIAALALAMPALATFEIKDPAAEMQAQDQAMANPGARSCFDLLTDSVEQPEVYRAAVNWVNESLGGPSRIETEAALKTFCIDHPRHSLAEAVVALGGAAAPAD